MLIPCNLLKENYLNITEECTVNKEFSAIALSIDSGQPVQYDLDQIFLLLVNFLPIKEAYTIPYHSVSCETKFIL